MGPTKGYLNEAIKTQKALINGRTVLRNIAGCVVIERLRHWDAEKVESFCSAFSLQIFFLFILPLCFRRPFNIFSGRKSKNTDSDNNDKRILFIYLGQ